ncbi:S-adenosyl-L-methionine-dependent methyltransferase [Gongronella butleri]|nr:S-adenosyl-L-methionine-dependent methyltransferase [Gongronella butleri]
MSDTKKTTSSVQDVQGDESSTFGSRLLTDEDAVFNHNAWDHVEWDEEQEEYAKSQIEKHMASPVPEDQQEQYYADPASFWHKFYTKNENRFFKDRHWLKLEFPELFEAAKADAGPKRVFEVGCGAGNTLFPLLEQSENPDLFVYGADYAASAVQVVQSSPYYDTTKCEAFVWDLASKDLPASIEPGSLDMIVMIFVFSALAPDQWAQALDNVHRLLKPGGLVLFRDYGRHDLAQLRFKKNRLLKENFYIRGDGTRVYFFTSDEISNLFVHDTDHPRFTVEQNAVDRRLLVNRSRKLKMYRVWLQGKFRKTA